MKNGSIAIGEMQIKNTVKYNSMSSGMANIKKNDHTKWWWRCGATGNLIYYFGKHILLFKKIVNIYLPYAPSVSLLGSYPGEWRLRFSKRLIQSTKNLSYIHSYSGILIAMQRKTTPYSLKDCMNLTDVMLRERSKTQEYIQRLVCTILISIVIIEF